MQLPYINPLMHTIILRHRDRYTFTCVKSDIVHESDNHTFSLIYILNRYPVVKSNWIYIKEEV